jgi:DNA polymerase I-like protein with 3'-5' exonuclease and polymerase domains
MLTGFKCGGTMSKNQLLNYPNQGPAFHCLLWSIIQMNKWLKKYKMKSKLIWNIHDDMGMDINIKEKEDVLQKAKEIMCIDIKKEWEWIITPLEIEAEFSNKNWYEKKEIKV